MKPYSVDPKTVISEFQSDMTNGLTSQQVETQKSL